MWIFLIFLIGVIIIGLITNSSSKNKATETSKTSQTKKQNISKLDELILKKEILLNEISVFKMGSFSDFLRKEYLISKEEQSYLGDHLYKTELNILNNLIYDYNDIGNLIIGVLHNSNENNFRHNQIDFFECNTIKANIFFGMLVFGIQQISIKNKGEEYIALFSELTQFLNQLSEKENLEEYQVVLCKIKKNNF